MPGQCEIAAEANHLVRGVGCGLGQLKQISGGVGAAPAAQDANRRGVDLGVGVVDGVAHGPQGARPADCAEHSH